MSAKKPDGGSAFPLRFSEVADRGMSLRDYFAAQALNGMLQDNTNVLRIAQSAAEGELPEAAAARSAYGLADAMLLERAK